MSPEIAQINVYRTEQDISFCLWYDFAFFDRDSR